MGDPQERLGSMGLGADPCMEIDPPLQEHVATAKDWRKALHKVVPAIVVLRAMACRAFDNESASGGFGTGFVVDKRRGIILTSRQGVKPGAVSQLLFG